MSYDNLVYNVFFLYNRDFYNCLVYGHLLKNTFFKKQFKTAYDHLIDRSSFKGDVTKTVADVISVVKSKSKIEQNQVIQPYSTFLTSTKNTFMKDDIIFAFNDLVKIICGEDNDSGLRNISNILSLSGIESTLTNKGISFPSLFSDMQSKNLKEQITDSNKVYFEVNNHTNELAKYLFDNSIDYSSSLHLKTDYTRNYDKNKPNEFTYVANKKGNGYDRGFRLSTDKNVATEHYKGYAVDFNMNLTGINQSGSKNSMAIKKLMIMNYLFTNESNSMIPYRFEISSLNYSVPHIHMDKTTNSSIQPSSGISLFKSINDMEFMNGGDTSTEYYNKLYTKVKTSIEDMIQKTYIINSDYSRLVTYTDDTTELLYERQRVKLSNNSIILVGNLNMNDIINGKIIKSYVDTTISESEKLSKYNIYKNDLNEFKQLNKISFDNNETGYSPKNRDTHGFENLRRSVEYLSYVMNACVVEYFRTSTSIIISDLWDVITSKIKVEGNFIVIEK